jgi:hypothetical protein
MGIAMLYQRIHLLLIHNSQGLASGGSIGEMKSLNIFKNLRKKLKKIWIFFKFFFSQESEFV